MLFAQTMLFYSLSFNLAIIGYWVMKLLYPAQRTITHTDHKPTSTEPATPKEGEVNDSRSAILRYRNLNR